MSDNPIRILLIEDLKNSELIFGMFQRLNTDRQEMA
jgi:hypothetical protein